MSQQPDQPFDSIESAYDFLRILAEAVTEAKRDIEEDVQRESKSNSSRRFEAMRIAAYNVEKLEFHVNRSRRILNDLRSLRRLLFAERAIPKAAAAPAPVLKTVPPPSPRVPAPPALPLQVAKSKTRRGTAGVPSLQT